MAKILIVGGGFAGLIAAEELARSFQSGAHQITVVSRKSDFVFYPALVQVAFGRLDRADISFNLSTKLSKIGVRFVEGDIVRIDAGAREVQVSGNDFDGKIYYDRLIIALGRRLATEKIPGFFEFAHHLLGVDAALRFGEAIESFQGGQIVVGMCPEARLPVPVCETAFALARRFEPEIKRKKASITIVFPETIEQAFGGAKVGSELKWTFEKHNIKLVTKFSIEEITAKQIRGQNKQTINHDLLMLVPPFRGNVILNRMAENSADEEDYAQVNRLMQVNGLPGVYAAGDIAGFAGPKFAHMAVRQASVAAENVIAEIIGESPAAEYNHEIATVIDAGGADTIHLHYGIWDDELYALQKGTLWSWAKTLHDKFWRITHS